MRKSLIFPVLVYSILMPVSFTANASVRLECKPGQKPPNKDLVKNVPALAALKNGNVEVALERDSSTIKFGGNSFNGEPVKKVSAEEAEYYVPLVTEFVLPELKDKDGTPIRLRVTSSSAYLGGKDATISFENESAPTSNRKAQTWDFNCTNHSAGEKAGFVTLCNKEPVLTSWIIGCRSEASETSTLPGSFDFTTGDGLSGVIMSDDMLDPKKQSVATNQPERLNFFVNQKTDPQFVEHCFFKPKAPTKDGLQELWLSRKFVATGEGPVLALTTPSSGPARTAYICGEDDHDHDE